MLEEHRSNKVFTDRRASTHTHTARGGKVIRHESVSGSNSKDKMGSAVLSHLQTTHVQVQNTQTCLFTFKTQIGFWPSQTGSERPSAHVESTKEGLLNLAVFPLLCLFPQRLPTHVPLLRRLPQAQRPALRPARWAPRRGYHGNIRTLQGHAPRYLEERVGN